MEAQWSGTIVEWMEQSGMKTKRVQRNGAKMNEPVTATMPLKTMPLFFLTIEKGGWGLGGLTGAVAAVCV